MLPSVSRAGGAKLEIGVVPRYLYSQRQLTLSAKVATKLTLLVR